MKHFYSHLIEVDTLIIELDSMDLSEKEKLHLAALIDTNLHHAILDAIFSQLSDGDKTVFLEQLDSKDHKRIWRFLNEKIDKVEEKIKLAAKNLKEELHKDIKKAHKIKSTNQN